jgi:hypothetical protein
MLLHNFGHHVRSFWTLHRGTHVGYIEAAHTSGLIFKNDGIDFRQTSSNVAHGEKIDLSTEQMTTKKPTADTVTNQYIRPRQSVVVEVQQDLFGLPWKGPIFNPQYVLSISRHQDEVLTVHTKQ